MEETRVQLLGQRVQGCLRIVDLQMLCIKERKLMSEI
jgi:hypothetical protein